MFGLLILILIVFLKLRGSDGVLLGTYPSGGINTQGVAVDANGNGLG